MVIRRLLRVALPGAVTLACSGDAYAPMPTALLGEYSVQAGTGFGTYDIALALEAIADSVHGRWRLAWQATCATGMGSSRARWSGIG